ncbi:helix-turn-helix transcriptional regulator [Hydrogenophaga defluvii]|uniref:Helix-turn-helix transcriptional regulator n=1 Tax=Hydrogenophaga defluvii TaxID=249410 RepID=A0ABW2SDG4_9BURK
MTATTTKPAIASATGSEVTKPARTACASARLSLKEVAERMNMCARSIQKLVAKGRFPRGVYLGRDVFWLETVVDEWLEAQFASQLAWEPKKRGTSAKAKLVATS